MSKQQKIHEENDYNHAEKTAANILHWFTTNYQVVIAIALVIGVIIWFSDKMYKQNLAELDASKTDYAALYLTSSTTGTFSAEELTNFYDTTTAIQLQGYAAYQLASLAMAEKEYAGAIEWYDNALATVPSAEFVLAGIYEGKGVALESTGDLNGALEQYKKALDATGNDFRTSNIRMKIALLLQKSNDTEGVKAECEAIVSDTLASVDLVQNANNILLAL